MAAHQVKKPSAPALGLSDCAILHSCMTRANVDWIDVVVEAQTAHQLDTIKDAMPTAWPREGRGAVHVSFALPGKTGNASEFIRLTFHDPLSGGFRRKAIEDFIQKLCAVRRPTFDAIEHGVDVVRPAGKAGAVSQELMNAWGAFAAELARCIRPVNGLSIYRLPQLRTHTGNKISGDPYMGIARALASGKTVYIGNSPKWKDKRGNHRMTECTQLRDYKKTSDHPDSPKWPEARHFFRIEQTSLGRAMPIADVLDLLDEDQFKANAAKVELAKCWHAHHVSPGFLGLVQRWKLQFEENLDSWVKAEAKDKNQKPYKYAMKSEPCRTANTTNGMPTKPSEWPKGQTRWNDRMDKAFLRLPRPS